MGQTSYAMFSDFTVPPVPTLVEIGLCVLPAGHAFASAVAETRLEVRQMLERMKEQSPTLGYVEYRETLLARMFDVSVFMRELKQRFTQWYNKKAKRKGP